MAADPTAVADFVSSPVRLETVPVYPVDHYGSAASPFYTILAIWVGALFLVAIIHVGVKPIEPGIIIRRMRDILADICCFS